jgi:hypothetical protein
VTEGTPNFLGLLAFQPARHSGLTGLPLPCAATVPEAALKARDHGLDPGPELSEPVVNILTAAHVGYFDTALLGEVNVPDTTCFGIFQVVLEGKTAVYSGLEWIAAVNSLLALEAWFGSVCCRPDCHL